VRYNWLRFSIRNVSEADILDDSKQAAVRKMIAGRPRDVEAGAESGLQIAFADQRETFLDEQLAGENWIVNV
jgi:hypothetical protein